MINSLTVINLKAEASVRASKGEVFILKTCQRTLVLGYGQLPFYHLEDQNDIRDMFNGDQAYIFLLETICGLKSEVLGEYEVVGQFKEAYQDYVNLPQRNTNTLTLLEKLFQDSKKVRTDHLSDIGQLSYAGIARKLVHTKTNFSDVLIVGSGNLSVDLIKLLKKKHRVFLTARNTERVNELCLQQSVEMITWQDFETYKKFDSIVNTIGSEEILFNEEFFQEFSSRANVSDSKLFIDLGSPSVIKTDLTESAGVFRLEDIFRQSAKMNIEKMEKIKCAKESIVKLCENRRQIFSLSHPSGWEELRLA